MSNYENKSQKIYYRPLHKWIEVTQEETTNWDRYIGSIRKRNQRAGACCVPLKKSYKCDGVCEGCEFRCIPADEPQRLSIQIELENIEQNGMSKKSFLADEALTTEISIDSMILNRLLKELKNKEPENYQILMLIAEGLPERVCAERMNIPRNTFVYRRDKLLSTLKKYF